MRRKIGVRCISTNIIIGCVVATLYSFIFIFSLNVFIRWLRSADGSFSLGPAFLPFGTLLTGSTIGTNNEKSTKVWIGDAENTPVALNTGGSNIETTATATNDISKYQVVDINEGSASSTIITTTTDIAATDASNLTGFTQLTKDLAVLIDTEPGNSAITVTFYQINLLNNVKQLLVSGTYNQGTSNNHLDYIYRLSDTSVALIQQYKPNSIEYSNLNVFHYDSASNTITCDTVSVQNVLGSYDYGYMGIVPLERSDMFILGLSDTFAIMYKSNGSWHYTKAVSIQTPWDNSREYISYFDKETGDVLITVELSSSGGGGIVYATVDTNNKTLALKSTVTYERKQSGARDIIPYNNGYLVLTCKSVGYMTKSGNTYKIKFAGETLFAITKGYLILHNDIVVAVGNTDNKAYVLSISAYPSISNTITLPIYPNTLYSTDDSGVWAYSTTDGKKVHMYFKDNNIYGNVTTSSGNKMAIALSDISAGNSGKFIYSGIINDPELHAGYKISSLGVSGYCPIDGVLKVTGYWDKPVITSTDIGEGATLADGEIVLVYKE